MKIRGLWSFPSRHLSHLSICIFSSISRKDPKVLHSPKSKHGVNNTPCQADQVAFSYRALHPQTENLLLSKAGPFSGDLPLFSLSFSGCYTFSMTQLCHRCSWGMGSGICSSLGLQTFLGPGSLRIVDIQHSPKQPGVPSRPLRRM